MARFNVEEVEHYGGSGGGGFFSLKDHKDMATVRFMYNTMQDLEAFSVHEVEVDGKKRYVNCLREYNEPIDACPFCEAKLRVVPKIFIILYDEDTQEVKIWDRGKTFYSKMSSLFARHNPLVSTVFEIERNGKKGDQKTTYETFSISTDETALEDLPEMPELLGTLILDKTAEDMVYYLDYDTFPATEDEAQARQPEKDTRRRSAPATNKPAGRQAPATTRQSRPAGNVDQHAPDTTATAPAGRRRPETKHSF